jgi:hypothetical protein
MRLTTPFSPTVSHYLRFGHHSDHPVADHTTEDSNDQLAIGQETLEEFDVAIAAAICVVLRPFGTVTLDGM